MSTAQVERLQALLSRVQQNRARPRPVAATAAQDSIDTTPPPPAPVVKPQPQVRPVIEPERVRVPDMKPVAPAPRVSAQPERAMPAPARPTAPGATPLEMALEGEVARAAEIAASMPAPVPRPQPVPAPLPEPVGSPVEPRRAVAVAPETEVGPRVLADPTPPQPSRPVVQAVTKHPPVQPHTFTELLKRSLALRPR